MNIEILPELIPLRLVIRDPRNRLSRIKPSSKGLLWDGAKIHNDPLTLDRHLPPASPAAQNSNQGLGSDAARLTEICSAQAPSAEPLARSKSHMEKGLSGRNFALLLGFVITLSPERRRLLAARMSMRRHPLRYAANARSGRVAVCCPRQRICAD